MLHTRPSLNPLLLEIFLRFSENRGAGRGIKKAFLNISVHVSDCDCFRFLWVDDISESNSRVVLSCFWFCQVVFGLNASPFLLNETIRHHLATFTEANPEFVRKMVEAFTKTIWFQAANQQTIQSLKQGKGQNSKQWVQTAQMENK